MRQLHSDAINKLPGKIQTLFIEWAEARFRKKVLARTIAILVVTCLLLWSGYMAIKHSVPGAEGMPIEDALNYMATLNSVVCLLASAVFAITLYQYISAKRVEKISHAALSKSYDIAAITPEDVHRMILMPRLSSASLTLKEYRSMTNRYWT